MSGVDNRIVTMKFDNKSFEQNAATSLSTLQKLKQSMSFGTIVNGAVKGLGAIDSAISKIGLRTPFSPFIRAANAGLGVVGNTLDRLGLKNPFSSGIQSASDLQKAAQTAGGPAGMGVFEGGVTAVSSKFIALSTIAITALSNITNRAISAGTAFLKSFTVAPILDGLHEYETNLKSIQTVQANTDQPLPKVNAALEELNRYSDQTIYNFSEMAKNVGTFTAAGVDLETSVSSIKGIANLAALSGSSSEQAATAMYQLSQAIASGKVGLQDWNSVVNAGMGGKKLQNALAQTAVAMGQIEKESVKLVGPLEKLEINGQSFRESIMAQPGQESWLSSDILVNTLASMDGRFSKAALAAERTEKGVRKYTDAQIEARIEESRANLERKNGVKYTDEQFKALQKMSTAAFKSATEVKTLGQVFDIAKETLASGYGASFKNIFGDLNQAKALFTPMSNGLNKIINDAALARNTMLNLWSENGGRDAAIEGLKNAWQALLGILGPIKEGFRDIFPATTATELISLSKGFQSFTEKLIPSEKTMANIRDIAGGVFAVFGIGVQIVKGIIDGFVALFDVVGGGNGNFLDFAAGIGRALESFNDFLKESGLITAFFQGLGNILAIPLGALQGLAGGLSSLFDGLDGDKVSKAGDAVGKAADKFKSFVSIGDKVRAVFESLGSFLSGLGESIGNAIGNLGEVIASFLTADAFTPALDAVNTGLLAAITATIIKFFSGGLKVDVGGGFLDGVADTLESATGALTTLQTNLKANILLKIGAAIGVLALSLLILASIDPGEMRKALAGMTAGFAVLIGALAVMTKVLGPAGLLQIYVASTAMVLLAGSMLILSGALKVMATINFGEMLRGLVGIGIALYIFNKALTPLAANSKGLLKASFSLILVGVALNLLAIALKIFATMSWEEMAKGLIGLTGTLLALAVGLKLMPDLNAEAITLIALGVAMNILAIALKIFATMSWEEMAKGLTTLAASLGIISAVLKTMGKGILLKAIGLTVVASALVILAGALKVMASLSWEEVAKGLVLLSGALLIIAIGLNAIGLVGTIGAIGLLAAAGALAVLAPILVTLGAMSWESIAKGLVGIAGVFAIIGIAGALLTPVIPTILALSAAILLLGAGLALAGVGALAAATAFGIVVAAGTTGAIVMTAILTSIINQIPKALAAFGRGVVQFAVAIGNGAPRIAKAFGQILTNILNSVNRNVPKLARTFLTLLNAALRVIVNATPRIVAAGLSMIISFLEAVNKKLPRIIDLATELTVKFINGIARNIGKVIQAGVNLIIKTVEGMARAIRTNSDRLGAAGADLGLAIIQGIARGITSSLGTIKDAAVNAAKSAIQSAKDFLKSNSPSKLAETELGEPIPQGWAIGIDGKAYLVEKAAVGLAKNTMSSIEKAIAGAEDILNVGGDPVITPVLDLSNLTREANKISGILETVPIFPSTSYAAAADISAITSAENDQPDPGSGSESGGGDRNVTFEQHLHSPKPIDSVEAYRNGKTLISLAMEELKS